MAADTEFRLAENFEAKVVSAPARSSSSRGPSRSVSPCPRPSLSTSPIATPRAASPAPLPDCFNGTPAVLPLLKFDQGADGKPYLCDSGVEVLASLPPPVSVVTLLGDGRCGKSTLASRLIDDERMVFPVGDTGTAVTEGIDMCVVPKGGSSAEGSLVVLDCEGGNNPTGAIRGAVDLVAMLASTLTVQVVWGQMSEGQLTQIGQGIAIRDRLLLGNTAYVKRLPAQRLLLVVNGCHLRYAQDQLSKTFLEVHTGTASARNELRSKIKNTFEYIDFATVPPEDDFAYLSQLEQLRNAVTEHCTPSALSGVRLSGAQISEMLKSTVDELRAAGTVPVPSVFRHVIYDHLLKPLVLRLLEKFRCSLPDLSDGEFRPMMSDMRSGVLLDFDSETQQLTHRELVDEAREDLRKRTEIAWQRVLEQNSAIGEQDRDVSTESEMRYSHAEERVVSWKKSCWVIGKKTPIVEACSVFRVWTRTRVLKKNGQVAYSDWAPSAHNVDGSSMGLGGSSMGGGRWSSNSYSGMVGERNCTPASPLMPHSQSLPPTFKSGGSPRCSPHASPTLGPSRTPSSRDVPRDLSMR